MAFGFSDRYFFKDGLQLKNAPSSDAESGVTVYELIKIVGGIPLFFEDHMLRLQHSLQLALQADYRTFPFDFLASIQALCAWNEKYFGNVEIKFSRSAAGKITCLMGFVPHTYPDAHLYLEGVKVALMPAIREQPNVKIRPTKTRLKANEFIAANPVFEVLLVNNKGCITEGSRSNLFFIKENTLITAPLQFILPGITRKHVLEAIAHKNFPLREQLLETQALGQMDAAFLSGTSLGILPIRSIDSLHFDVQNHILRSIMIEFNTLVQEYLASRS